MEDKTRVNKRELIVVISEEERRLAEFLQTSIRSGTGSFYVTKGVGELDGTFRREPQGVDSDIDIDEGPLVFPKIKSEPSDASIPVDPVISTSSLTSEEHCVFQCVFEETGSKSEHEFDPEGFDMKDDSYLAYMTPEVGLHEMDPETGTETHLLPDLPTSPKRIKRFRCPICDSVGVSRAFEKPSQLKSHIMYHKKTGKAILRMMDTQPRTRIPIPLPSSSSEYTCATCNNRVFTDRKLYIQHLNAHRKMIRKYGYDRPLKPRTKSDFINIPVQDKYTCPTCGKEFEDRNKFGGHLKYHRMREELGQGQSKSSSSSPSKPSEYTCEKCGKVLKASSYRPHMRHHRIKEEALEKERKRIERIRPDIPVQDSYHCDMCDRDFPERIKFIGHVRHHEKLEKQGCNRPIAVKTERIEDDEDQADAEDQEEQNEHHHCETCNRSFETKSRFKYHMKLHKKLIERGEQDRPIWEKATQPSWKNAIPEGLDTYLCETCPNRSFDSRDAFINHMSIHRSLRRKGKDRPIMSKEGFIERNRTETTCDVCSEKFPTKTAYENHFRKEHRQKKRDTENAVKWKEIPIQDVYICEKCENREFTEREKYINHLKVHKKLAKDGEDRVIISREQWAQQVKEMRAQGKFIKNSSSSFHCQICDKKFSKRTIYKAHLRYHSNRKKEGKESVRKNQSWKEIVPFGLSTYTCEKCPSRSFTERDSYIGHLNYHRILERKGKTFGQRQRETRLGEDRKCPICPCRIFVDSKAYAQHMSYHKLIKRKTGQDREISTIKADSSGSGTGRGGKGSIGEMLNSLIKEGCTVACLCGETFFFNDALDHHLSLKKSEACGKVSVKMEVKAEETEADQEEELEPSDLNVRGHYNDNDERNPGGGSTTPVTDTEEGHGHPVVVSVMTLTKEDGDEEILDEDPLHHPYMDCEDGHDDDEMEVQDPLSHEPSLNDNENASSCDASSSNICETEADSEILRKALLVATVIPQAQAQTVPVIVPLQNPVSSNEDEGTLEDEEDFSGFYECQICNQDNPSLTKYLRHQYQFHGIDNELPLSCPFCVLQFPSPSNLHSHCKDEHGEISAVKPFSFPCTLCPGSLTVNITDGPELQLHFSTAHPKLVCRMCKKLVSSPAILNKHIVSEHMKKGNKGGKSVSSTSVAGKSEK